MADEDIAIGDYGDGDDPIEQQEEHADEENQRTDDVIIPDTFGINEEESSKHSNVSDAIIDHGVIDQSFDFDDFHPVDDDAVDWNDEECENNQGNNYEEVIIKIKVDFSFHFLDFQRGILEVHKSSHLGGDRQNTQFYC